MVNMKTIAITSILTVVICTATMAVLLSLPESFWTNWRPATCVATGCFCEAIYSTDVVRQPANAWSSLSYVAIGSLVIAVAGETTGKKRRLPYVYAYILGISAIIIGVGSAFYHASITFVGQFFDVFGMYLFANFMLVYALERLFKWSSNITLGLYIVINLVLSSTLIFIPETIRYMFAAVIIIALVFEYVVQRKKNPRIETHWLNIGLLIFATAYVIWILDNSKIVCDPQSLVQGHAVWHLLGAVAVGFLYLYYVSENPS